MTTTKRQKRPSVSSPFLVYGLCDPLTGQLRYVGKSTSGSSRPYQHSTPSELKRTGHTHKGCWIKSLLAKGLKPEVWIIEEYPTGDTLCNEEIWYIAYFRFLGCDLTNLTFGGEGACGVIKSDGTKDKLRAARGGPLPHKREEIYLSYLTGKSIYKIAKLFKVAPATVYRVLLDRGVKMRGKERYRIVDQFGTSYGSMREAARLLGISQGNLSRVLDTDKSLRGYRFSSLFTR